MNKRLSFSRRSGLIAVVVSVVAMFALVGVVFAANLTSIIDHFNGNQSQLLTYVGVPISGTSTVLDPGVWGGERDIISQINAGQASQNLLLTVNNGGDSSLVATSGTSVEYTTTVKWDGAGEANHSLINPTGLGGIDLTQGGTRDRFVVGVSFTDLGAPIIIRVYSSATSCSERSQLPGTVNGLNSKLLEYTYVSFATTCQGFSTPANFTNVGAIALVINANGPTYASTDMSLHLLGTTKPPYLDYGDLPDSYEVNEIGNTNNARHIVMTSSLGLSVTVEPGKRGNTAIEDTFDDGVKATTPNWTTGVNGGHFVISATNCVGTCYLTAFIDWDNNGTFWDTIGGLNWQSGEKVLTDYPITNGSQTVAINIPTGTPISSGSFYARFRLTDENLSGLGSAWGTYFSGEVEDYLLTFGPLAVTMERLDAKPANTNNAAVPILAGAVLALGVVAVAIRRRKPHTL